MAFSLDGKGMVRIEKMSFDFYEESDVFINNLKNLACC